MTKNYKCLERVSEVKSDSACMMRVAEFIFLSDKDLSNFGPFSHQKGVILGLRHTCISWNTYIQYKICFKREDLYLVPCKKTKG